jgi:hypothetical protein
LSIVAFVDLWSLALVSSLVSRLLPAVFQLEPGARAMKGFIFNAQVRVLSTAMIMMITQSTTSAYYVLDPPHLIKAYHCI